MVVLSELSSLFVKIYRSVILYPCGICLMKLWKVNVKGKWMWMQSLGKVNVPYFN